MPAVTDFTMIGGHFGLIRVSFINYVRYFLGLSFTLISDFSAAMQIPKNDVVHMVIIQKTDLKIKF